MKIDPQVNDYLAGLVGEKVSELPLEKSLRINKSRKNKPIEDLFKVSKETHKIPLMAHVHQDVYEYVVQVSRKKGLSKSRVIEVMLTDCMKQHPLVEI